MAIAFRNSQPILLALLLSCVSSQFIPHTNKKYPPYNGIVQVFYQQPEAPFESLGLVTVTGEGVGISTMLSELKRKAALIGANAVIVRQNSSHTSGGVAMPIYGTGMSTYLTEEVKEMVATALYIRATSPEPVTPKEAQPIPPPPAAATPEANGERQTDSSPVGVVYEFKMMDGRTVKAKVVQSSVTQFIVKHEDGDFEILEKVEISSRKQLF